MVAKGIEAEVLSMSPAERGKACVLIIETDANDRNNMRTALRSLGFGGVSDVSNIGTALERLEQRKFSHIIFNASSPNFPTTDFVKKVLETSPTTVMIPSSCEPNVDDVFNLLILGAKGYLCKPFTIDTVDMAVVNATKGEPIAEAVLQARDRNEALVAILMQSLDKAATILRQAQQFETARREVPKAMVGFKRASELALTFAKGGESGLLEALERFCIERSKGPATRLGRLRKRLKTKRVDEDDPVEEGAAPTGEPQG